MKKVFKSISVVLFSTGISISAFSQSGKPVIETGACPVKIGPGVISVCGYLVAPENRNRPKGAKVKVPFIFVRRADMSATKNISLFTTGGPGYSTVENIDSIGEGSGWLAYGGLIAFDQRGSKRSIPSLESPSINEAIRQSYRMGLDRDSLVHLAIKRARASFASRGIDLSSYTTIESAEDINDLRVALGIDSLNLVGISYSGGLMLTVARNHPEAVRTLVLNSPLPGFVNYEEHALSNINEGLENFFDYCNADTAIVRRYGDLRVRFHEYFTGITGRTFSLRYWDAKAKDSITVHYRKDELMDVVLDRMNANGFKELPLVMNDLISGKHSPYVNRVLDGYFSENQRLSHGMRYSIYCTEQIAYADTALINRQQYLFPWLAGFAFNSVDHPLCDCWKVKPEPAVAKTPVYSRVPALIAGGDIDPWCSPFYNRLIKRTIPNAQLLFFRKRGHGPGFGIAGADYLRAFFNDPLKPLNVQGTDVWKE